jgi:hypothetical protein
MLPCYIRSIKISLTMKYNYNMLTEILKATATAITELSTILCYSVAFLVQKSYSNL